MGDASQILSNSNADAAQRTRGFAGIPVRAWKRPAAGLMPIFPDSHCLKGKKKIAQYREL